MNNSCVYRFFRLAYFINFIFFIYVVFSFLKGGRWGRSVGFFDLFLKECGIPIFIFLVLYFLQYMILGKKNIRAVFIQRTKSISTIIPFIILAFVDVFCFFCAIFKIANIEITSRNEYERVFNISYYPKGLSTHQYKEIIVRDIGEPLEKYNRVCFSNSEYEKSEFNRYQPLIPFYTYRPEWRIVDKKKPPEKLKPCHSIVWNTDKTNWYLKINNELLQTTYELQENGLNSVKSDLKTEIIILFLSALISVFMMYVLYGFNFFNKKEQE